VIVSLVRSKLIAVWIGPVGMGISGLLTATMGIVNGLSNLGIEISAVRHISGHFREGDPDAVAVPVAITRRIALFTGLGGAALALLLSPWLSQLTFGDYAHSMAFAWLSVTVLLRQLSSGELAVLQSLRRIRWLARANLYGNLAGLAVSVPLYYLYRIDAIVPAIVAMSAAATVFSFAYSFRVKIRKPELRRRDFFREGKSILKLGIVMTMSSVLTLLGAWAIQVYISQHGGTAMVGFYNAGFTLLNSYVGLLFTAMGTDYFPRLSALAHDDEKMHAAVREQSVIGLLIITPIIAFFLTFAPTITKVLFTKSFTVITTMVCLGMAGMLFRTVSFTIGYMVLAKADTRLFVWSAIGFNALLFGLSLGGYYLYGLAGLGSAFAVHYVLHFAILSVIARFRYGYRPDAGFAKIFSVCLLITALATAALSLPHGAARLGLSLALTTLASVYSLWQVNQKIDILALIQKIRSKLWE
jgi:O-antigen/teichoic acid export membrane protein